MQGWIKLHRKICEHWVWKDPDKLRAWLDMIILANHDGAKFISKGELVTLEPGQFITSTKKLADRWGWSANKVRRFMVMLKTDEMCTLSGTHNGTLITLTNYGFYQLDRRANGTANGTPNGTADGTLTRMNKNDKEGVGGAQRRRPRMKSKEEDDRMCEEIIREYEEKEKNGNA